MRHVFRVALLAICLASGGAGRADDEAERLRIARELIVVNQTIEQADAMFPMLMSALKPMITGNNPKIEKDFDQVMGLVAKEFEPFKAQLVDDMARLQARAFSKAELEEILNFSKSATGQKMIRLMPSLAKAGMELGQQYGHKAAGQLVDKMKEELRKRGHNI